MVEMFATQVQPFNYMQGLQDYYARQEMSRQNQGAQTLADLQQQALAGNAQALRQMAMMNPSISQGLQQFQEFEQGAIKNAALAVLSAPPQMRDRVMRDYVQQLENQGVKVAPQFKQGYNPELDAALKQYAGLQSPTPLSSLGKEAYDVQQGFLTPEQLMQAKQETMTPYQQESLALQRARLGLDAASKQQQAEQTRFLMEAFGDQQLGEAPSNVGEILFQQGLATGDPKLLAAGERMIEKAEKKQSAKLENTVPGYELRGDVLPTRAESVKLRQSVATRTDLTRIADSLIDEVSTGGTAYLSSRSDKIKQDLRKAELQLKNLEELGALTGPDVDYLRSIIPDPSSLYEFATSGVRGTKSLLQRLGRFKQGLEARVDAQAESMGYRPQITTVTTQQEFDALPSGTRYREPDGKEYIKP